MFRIVLSRCFAVLASALVASGQPYSEVPRAEQLAPLYQIREVVPELTNIKLRRLSDLQTWIKRDYADRATRLIGLPPYQYSIRINELDRLYGNYWSAGVREILSSDDINRYRQIELPYTGPNILNNPYVPKYLDLNQSQREHLKDLAAWERQQWDVINRQMQYDIASERQRYASYLQNYQLRLYDVITPNESVTPAPAPAPPPIPTEPSQLRGPFTVPKP